MDGGVSMCGGRVDRPTHSSIDQARDERDECTHRRLPNYNNPKITSEEGRNPRLSIRPKMSMASSTCFEIYTHTQRPTVSPTHYNKKTACLAPHPQTPNRHPHDPPNPPCCCPAGCGSSPHSPPPPAWGSTGSPRGRGPPSRPRSPPPPPAAAPRGSRCC